MYNVISEKLWISSLLLLSYFLRIEFEELAPRIDTLRNAHEEDLATAADLERRIGNVLRQYTTRVCTAICYDISIDY